MLSGHTVTGCHIRITLLTDRERKLVHADVTDKQLHSANRRPRWVWESGSRSLFKGLVPFYTTGILLPGLQITLFFKQFSTTCLTPSYCFQALFSHSDLADYIRKLQTIWKFDSSDNVEHTRTNMHTSPYLCGGELHNTRKSGEMENKEEEKKKWQSHKKMWQLTSRLINRSRLQETLKMFLEATNKFHCEGHICFPLNWKSLVTPTELITLTNQQVAASSANPNQTKLTLKSQ